MATLYTANNGTNGQELWVSYGSPSSSFMLKDIRSGALGSSPQLLGYLMVAGVQDQSRVLFLANDGTTGAELWVTDGTAAGTVQFKDLNAGAAGSFPGAWTGLAANSVFAATDATNGRELWVSDGTAGGTALLTNLNPGAASSDPVFLGKLIANGAEDTTRAMYVLTNGTSGREIWVTDGTAAGTTQLADINPGAAGSDPSAWQAIGTKAVFVANNGTSGRELWASDGTGAGTALLLDAAPGLAGSDPEFLGRITTPGGQRLVFALNNITNGRELWVTDGTGAGTTLFKDINPGAGSADPGALATVGGRVVFVANDGTNGAELWASDGTAAGTAMLVDAKSGAAGSAPELRGNLIVGGVVDPTRLLYLLDNGTTGQELWVTDGTLAGTTQWNDANPGSPGSFATDTTMEVKGPTIDLTPATGPVTLALGEAGVAQTVIGSAFADAIVGNEKANTITSGDGDDVILTVGGDDTIDAGAGNDLLNGGAGSNTAIFHGIRGASEIRFDSKTFDLTVVGPDGVDTLTNMQVLKFTDMTVNAFDTTGVRHLVNVSFPVAGTDQFMVGNAYTGPVPGLTDEFIFPTPQNINIASALPNAFIRTGTGDDAITVFTGNNVVDAYQGSNFLTSGTGNDTFFVDARGGGSTWDTIVNFTAGDAVTLWGYKAGTSADGTTDKWYQSDGTPGFTGLTVHAKLDGSTIDASITFAGTSLADLSKFSVTTGSVAGNDYLQITRAT